MDADSPADSPAPSARGNGFSARCHILGVPADALVERTWLGLLVLCVALWALASLWEPYAWDHGCFAWVSDTIVHGGLPYRDAGDFKGPLAFYIVAALQLAFGRQMWAIRAFDLLMLAVAMTAGIRLLSQFVSRRAALCTMLMAVLAFASFGSWYTAQPDGWAALSLVVVVSLLVTNAPVSAVNAALAAAVIGACTLVKPVYALYTLLVLFAVYPASRAERATALRNASLAAAAFLLPIGLTAVWFAAHGALGDLVDVYLRFNIERIADDPARLPFSQVVLITAGVPTSLPILAVALPAAALGAGYVTRERTRAGAILVLWALLSLVAIGAQRKFLKNNYSWHPFFQAMAVLAGIGLSRLWNARAPELRAGRWLVVVTAVALFKLASHDPLVAVGRWARYVTGRISIDQYRDAFDFNPFYGPASNFGFSVSRDFRIADFLRSRTGPSDEVMIWSDPLVNYLSDRPSLTRITGSPPYTKWSSEARRRGYRAELLARMAAPHAMYFGVASRDLASGSDDEQNIPQYFPELLRFLDAAYDRVEKIDDVQLFRRRGR